MGRNDLVYDLMSFSLRAFEIYMELTLVLILKLNFLLFGMVSIAFYCLSLN